MRPVSGYASKAELVERRCRGQRVLHLGAVGETYSNPQTRIDLAPQSVHAWLSDISAKCVGVDYDKASVEALTSSGVFDNLICADVTTMTRADVPLERIDAVVIGDIIEHLSNPGAMLDALHQIVDPGTEVVLTTPNALALPIFLRHLQEREIEGLDHVVSFNRASLENLLTRHGWRIDELWTCYQRNAEAMHGGIKFRMGKALLSRCPKLGGTLLAVLSPH